jgi:hypothetical protein
MTELRIDPKPVAYVLLWVVMVLSSRRPFPGRRSRMACKRRTGVDLRVPGFGFE